MKLLLSACLLTLLTLLLTGNGLGQSLDDLTLITEEYPPFNFTEYGLHRGIATDALIEMLGAAGTLISHKDIASLPWARGYRIARRGPMVLLYSMTRTEAREKLFKWVGPIVEAKIVLLAKKSSKIALDRLDQLNDQQLKVGVVLDDVGHQLLQQQGINDRLITPLNQGAYLAQMLMEGRIDLAAYDELVIDWYLRQAGADPREFIPVHTLETSGYYYALSFDTSDELVALLQKELDRLKQRGRLEEIVKSYLP